MPGAGAELAMRLGEQRRRAGHEQANVRAALARERRMLQQPRVERRHAHHHRCFRQQPHDFVGIELRQEQHRAAGREHGVDRDEQPVHVKDRQGVQQHVALRESPRLRERDCVRREIRARQHRALGAAGRAGRVQQRGEIGLLSRVRRRTRRRGFARARAPRAGRRRWRRRPRPSDRRRRGSTRSLQLVYAVLSGTNTAPRRRHARYSAMASGDFSTCATTRSPGRYRALRERRGDAVDEPVHRAVAHALSVGGPQQQPIGMPLRELGEPGGGIGVRRGVRCIGGEYRQCPVECAIRSAGRWPRAFPGTWPRRRAR